MPDVKDTEIKLISIGDLGPGNEGGFGPGSEHEHEAVKDVQDEWYWGPRSEKSACMDDRLEGLRLHLAGNRAVTEVAAGYMGRHAEQTSLSRAMERKINELKSMGREPVFHLKCAALAAIKPALEFAAEHEDEVVSTLWPKLDAVGATEFLTEQQLRNAIKNGSAAAGKDEIWDATPEELLETAKKCGVEIEDAPGDHHAAGNLDNMSRFGFNNGQFRKDHQADDGEPLGLLTIDWAGYRDQLLQDGFTDEDAARMLMRGGLFIVSVQKMINKDGSPVATVAE